MYVSEKYIKDSTTSKITNKLVRSIDDVVRVLIVKKKKKKDKPNG